MPTYEMPRSWWYPTPTLSETGRFPNRWMRRGDDNCRIDFAGWIPAFLGQWEAHGQTYFKIDLVLDFRPTGPTAFHFEMLEASNDGTVYTWVPDTRDLKPTGEASGCDPDSSRFDSDQAPRE